MRVSPGQRTGTQRDQLIESHLPLVRAIARRYAGRGESVDDLAQVGAIGLIRASDRFDPRRGANFATFATPAIEGEIRRHLGDQVTSLRIPRELQRRARDLGSAREHLRASLGHDPSINELAEALGEEVEDVERALEAERARERAPAPADGMELEDQASPARSEDRLLLVRGARVLDERERHILLLRFHRDLTERQIANELGISQPHVSRLLSRALAKLREALDEDAAASPNHPVRERREQSQDREPPAARKVGSGSSGRFLVRMPGALHEELTQAAEREHVSLNRFITERLSESVSRGNEPALPDSESSGDTQDGRQRLRMLVLANLVIIVLAASAAIVLLVLALERGV